eukprot:CAMPEP_0201517920 /NCGR_PEP_ID=MMETSP0161_2-20130828/8894_1 /ASSEMBLY_ACC=CAM_ASM_000251 /TAXON_ID=180227 /ORGANISM="Neoparamoeba aestuarina, Strain SoJaBio B1-5/56/2" /LENGTH=362 /DNA_ID=CAMNT_0047915555 /DNA_START=93 /DNA_END=1181 /DNA_ORIENTATION=+
MMKIVVVVAALVACALGSSIPTNFDSRTEWKQCGWFILNQEQCGSCWDFCSVESFADRLCINGEAKSGTIISPEPILDCSGQGCDGGYPKTAWDWIISNGGDTTCTSQCFSGCSPYLSGDGTSPRCGDHNDTCKDGQHWSAIYQAHSFESLSPTFGAKNLTYYQEELMNNGPLQACFTVYNNFYNFFDFHPDGIYTSASGGKVGGHCVKMIGWGTEQGQDYWLFANSWDTTWADGGYFKMARGTDLCGIENSVSEGFTAKQGQALNKPKGIHPNVKANEMLVGGWEPQNTPASPFVMEAAKAGLKLVDAKLNFDSVLKAETQVVAGVNFRLAVQTAEGHIVNMRVYRDLTSQYKLIEHEIKN